MLLGYNLTGVHVSKGLVGFRLMLMRICMTHVPYLFLQQQFNRSCSKKDGVLQEGRNSRPLT
jgi:hypothetical protein